MATIHGTVIYSTVPTAFQDFAGSEKYGAGASVLNVCATAVGAGASAGLRATAVGNGALSGTNGFAGGDNSSGGVGTTVIGRLCQITGQSCVGVGANISSAKNRVTLLGADARATFDDSITLGYLAEATAVNRCTVGTIGGSYDKELQIGLGLSEFGAAPPAVQPAAIVDAAAGATVDAEARTAINSLLAAMRARGTIAT